MYLIQLFLPLYDNRHERLLESLFNTVRDELTERFKGLTGYSRAPAEGLWKEGAPGTIRDDIIIYEVMAERLDRVWWKRYRATLEARFRQKQLVVRAQRISLL